MPLEILYLLSLTLSGGLLDGFDIKTDFVTSKTMIFLYDREYLR